MELDYYWTIFQMKVSYLFMEIRILVLGVLQGA